MPKAPTVIRFTAQVWQVKTLVDGGVNVTLALSDRDIQQVSQLLECKKIGALLEIAAVPVKQERDAEKKADPNRTGSRRTQRYPYRT